MRGEFWRINRMKLHKVAGLLIGVILFAVSASAQDRSTGGIKGKVRVETGSPAGVTVLVSQGDREVAHAATDRGGEFTVQNLAPGVYGLTFRKPGLSVNTIDKCAVEAGKTRTLNALYLSVDEGSITFIKGSVFDEAGRSLPNARVELARILDDGSLKKIDGRITNETGSFAFRLTPDKAKYRITAKADHRQTASKDVEVESAVVYRVAISLAVAK
jgi:Carboxypeptidase regulatory-like domain